MAPDPRVRVQILNPHLVRDAMAMARVALQHAQGVARGTTSLDDRATRQVTAALSSALVALDTAEDFATHASPPAGVIRSNRVLTPAEAQALRDRWTAANAGSPVLVCVCSRAGESCPACEVWP